MIIQRNNLQSELDDCKVHSNGITTIASTIASISTTEQVSTVAPDLSGYRLPPHIIPESYDLTLYPNLNDGTFKGVRVHSKGLSINSVHIDGDASSFEENEQFEVLILTKSNKAVILNGVIEIKIEYSGDMKDRIVGLYTSSYTRKDGTKVPIATTKFEPTYARQAFPCFDEPNMKATFTAHVLKPKKTGYISLSNMPQSTEESNENGVMVHFEESKKMSTYLACFIVCDFHFTSTIIEANNQTTIPLRVFAPRDQIEHTKFALDTSVTIMKYFTKYFDIPYPLPKLDLIAIPDFVSGAMEHWGLVTFRETALLYDEKKSSSSNKERVAHVIAHELSHSWFGNLVTMNWWNDLWLNEGFASYIEVKGVHDTFPEWQMMDQFLIDTLHSVLSLDATPASHPIIQSAITPDQITEIFDSITYDKGASILRMLDNAVTEDIFQKAVKQYLIKHQWGNAVTQYFWDELQGLVPEAVNITDVMSTWTVQMGYPILTVKEEGNEYVLTQKRFLKDYSNSSESNSPYGDKWTIPVIVLGPTSKFFFYDHTLQTFFKITKPPGMKWIKFNHNQVGYYRINYSPEHWNVLAANMEQMSISDKTHLLEESFSIAESGELSYGIPLELTSYLTKYTDFIPWSVASSKLGNLRKYLVDSLDYNEYLIYASNLVLPAYTSIGWDESESDTHLKIRARSIILNFACRSNNRDCLTIAKTKFSSWLNDPIKNEISQELRGIVFNYGIANSGKEEWFKLLDLYKNEIDASEKQRMLQALANVKETWLLQHLIQLGTIEGVNQVIRSQDYFTLLQYISSNPIGTTIVWNYVREKWTYLVDRFGLNDRYLGQLIPSITESFTTNFQLHEMETFFGDNPNAGAGALAREKALTNLRNNIKWVSSNRDDVIKWLKQHNSS
ncbi:hypothetical protein RI129_001673 [Pyrocoelia pectoralis]|uniref:Aminopeptidase n=1 Tax=Pyrocoelia pectoralis TaxID=417401 RepID=A0AAN7VZ12_9COLE